MKQLQRLQFLQGNKCFFCGSPIPEGQASVEHLDALSNGGKKSDENSVVCCKAVNGALGSLSIRDKVPVALRAPAPDYAGR
jgi:5-methylcytosine-specific restriction endonuclease McrA